MAKKSFKKGVKSIIDPIEKPGQKKEPSGKPKTSKKKAETTLTIETNDTCTVQNADIFYNQLLDASKTAKEITIQCNEVGDIDLAWLQILISFDAFARKKNIKVHYQMNITENAWQLIESSGLKKETEKFFLQK